MNKYELILYWSDEDYEDLRLLREAKSESYGQPTLTPPSIRSPAKHPQIFSLFFHSRDGSATKPQAWQVRGVFLIVAVSSSVDEVCIHLSLPSEDIGCLKIYLSDKAASHIALNPGKYTPIRGCALNPSHPGFRAQSLLI